MPKRTRHHRDTLIDDLQNDSQFAAHYVLAALEDSTAVFIRALRDVMEALTVRLALRRIAAGDSKKEV